MELPSRLALFGLTRVPAGHLEILRALAAGRDLHLFLLHPSPSLWEKVTHQVDRADAVRREDGDALAGKHGAIGHDLLRRCSGS